MSQCCQTHSLQGTAALGGMQSLECCGMQGCMEVGQSQRGVTADASFEHSPSGQVQGKEGLRLCKGQSSLHESGQQRTHQHHRC